ncbi:MAG: SEC59/DGK1/VTE5 family protein [Pyrobaculum sp.]
MFTTLRSLIARKIFHIAFVLLLAVPFFTNISIHIYIAILTFFSGFIYSIQVRNPSMWKEIRQNFFKTIEDVFTRLEALLPVERLELRAQYQKVLKQLEELIDTVERDYERRHGYLGVLMGAVGFTVALIIFGPAHLPASIVSMAVYDAVSAIAGATIGGRKILGKATVSGTAAGSVLNIATLTLVGYTIEGAILITLFVVIADVLTPEDNLTIPPAAAAGSYLSLLL